MKSSRVKSFVAGLLIANSAPHLATAVASKRHLTPLAGRESGPTVNAAWAGLNLVGGVALLTSTRRGGAGRWGSDLVAFETGCLAFAAWMAGTEGLLRVNHDRG